MRVVEILIICLFFSISSLIGQAPCSFHLVVLGSSTAAGTGPSSPDSTWVNKYRKHVQGEEETFQVTNLAIGGTTTYHIMPDDNVVVDRPAPNPSNNISQAIRLNASAILVNMPSNDTSNGFTTSEQLSNFAVLASVAMGANIPIWICTTQPKNFSNQSSIDTQVEVKDSVLNIYGDRALDFWTDFASPTNTLLPEYDSGDGTHMNDKAHALLVEKVIAKDLTKNGVVSEAFPDLGISGVEIQEVKYCGGDMSAVSSIRNYGLEWNDSIEIEYRLDGIVVGDTLISGLSTCQTESFTINVAINEAGDHVLSVNMKNSDSIITNNDMAMTSVEVLVRPDLQVESDTVCQGEAAILVANTDSEYVVNWYEDTEGGEIIATGESFQTQPLDASASYFAQAIRTEINQDEELFTTDFSDKDWNGVMYDFFPLKDIIIDSLEIKVKDLGTHGVTAYYKVGSHLDFENEPDAWTLWGTDEIVVSSEGQFHVLDFGALSLSEEVRVGVYIHMNNSGARLSYSDATEVVNYRTEELVLSTGTGISHIFSEKYFPRNWNGKVFYHHSVEPLSCKSDLMEVEANVSIPIVDLGMDLSLIIGEQWNINFGSQYSTYLWSDQSVASSFSFEALESNLGLNEIAVQITDRFGCMATDTIVILVLTNDEDQDGFPVGVDCNDQDPNVYPGAIEVPYNGVDDDCDESTFDDDLDEDGFALLEDCDDQDPNVNPGAIEVPYNGVDDDCDESTFDDDLDEDGFALLEDCDDQDSNVYPGAMEVPYNGVDDDCDESTFDDDLDEDGFVLLDDCDDQDSNVYPGAMEVPNNDIDEDCDGEDLITAAHYLGENEIKIYPNPASEFINIESSLKLNYNVNLINLNGSTLWRGSSNDKVPLSGLANGVIIIKVTDPVSGKFIQEKVIVVN